MQQILLIHGGDTFDTYEDYLNDLKKMELDFEHVTRIRWRDTIQDRLGKEYQVVKPMFPNNMNAKYLEWKIYFEKLIPFLSENIILVGHSLGGIFLAKYLSENEYSKTIKAIFLIAAPFNRTPEYSLGDFKLGNDFKRLADMNTKVHLIHSEDDPVVPFSDLNEYKRVLPKANVHIFRDRKHFNQSEFPELVAEIRKL